MCTLTALLLCLMACPKPGPAQPPAGSSPEGQPVEALIRLEPVLGYEELSQGSGAAIERATVTEAWTPAEEDPPEGCTGRVLIQDIVTEDAGGQPFTTRHKTCLGPEGYGHFAVFSPMGWVEYPIKWELLGHTAPGQVWSGVHGEGHERRCEATTTPFCSEGLATECVTTRPGRVIMLRQHFCPEQGWRGFEATLQMDGQPPQHYWSGAVWRGEERWPDPGLEARPLPEL